MVVSCEGKSFKANFDNQLGQDMNLLNKLLVDSQSGVSSIKKRRSSLRVKKEISDQ